MASASSESEVEFQINEDYASRYDRWREKEELQKLKDRYGDVQELPSESSSSESEDETAQELNPEIEKEFLKTLSYLKSKNPVIYDNSTEFFTTQGDGQKSVTVKEKREKPMFLKDYERQLILDKGGILTDEDEIDTESKVKQMRSLSPSYVEEQKQLKESFKQALSRVDEDQDFLTERKKTKEEMEKEDTDFLDWLKGQKTTVDDKKVKKDMKFLHDYWNNPKLDQQEAFLKDFILNKRYLEQEDTDRIPTYDEIVHDSEGLSEDEETLEKQENFEHKYNFRFEEPDPEFIKHYPRTMKDSLRREDDRRKKKREEVKERKRSERERKQEELKQLKALKRKEIVEKLDKLKEIAGNTQIDFDDDDLEGDFDPDAYDRKMKQMFDDEYYQMEGDEEKPEFLNDEDDDVVNWDKWQRPENSTDEVIQHAGEEFHCEDPEFNMDADYDPANQMLQEMLDSSRNKKKRRKSKFAELASKKKPVFNPDDKTFEEYLDEYYKLDYEDIVANLPCRFKYRDVPANDFGLSLEEILVAKDKELNRWCSLKKTCQYRSKEDERYDIQAYQKKAENSQKKVKILSSVYGPKNEEEEDTVPSGDLSNQVKKKRKKKNKIVPKTNEVEPKEKLYTDAKLDSVTSFNVEDDFVLDKQQKAKKNKVVLDVDTAGPEDASKISKTGFDKKQSLVLTETKSQKQSKKREINLVVETNSLDDHVGDVASSAVMKESVGPKKRKLSLENAGDKNFLLETKGKKKHKNHESNNSDSLSNHPTNLVPPVSKELKSVSKQNNIGKQKNKLRSRNKPFNKQSFAKHKMVTSGPANQAVSDERLRAYGINPKKFKKKQIWRNMF